MYIKLYAKVYVDNTAFAFDDAFDYLVPQEMMNTLKKGCRVIIPFGKGDKKRQGMVRDISTTSSTPKDIKLKYIAKQVDEEPVFDDEMFKIMDFLVNTTFCTHYEAIKAILPNSYGVNIIQRYKTNSKITVDKLENYSFEDRCILDFLSSEKDQKQLNAFFEVNTDNYKKKFEELLKNGDILETSNVNKKVNDKIIKCYTLSNQYNELSDNIKLTPKQKEVTEFLSSVILANKKEICYYCGVSDGVINTLFKRGLLDIVEKEILRTPTDNCTQTQNIDEIILSEEQQQVFDDIDKLRNTNTANVALLHGVTGSGKTSIFLKLIDETIKQNKKVIMLVPEIALTPQLLKSFKSIFGKRIAVFHSNLSLGEKLDEYKRILRQEADIVIGTRSAIFSPLKNIGLIIMDEEGESSYKSDSNPRYHAREVAKLRILQHNALLLLASATPSIESYYKACNGIYKLFSLTNRYNNNPLPDVYIVDRSQEEKDANLFTISRTLKEEIERNLENKEQTILFINRRGYNTVASCMDCGEPIKCYKCDIPMTYHKANGYLMCHYCGHSRKFEKVCPTCKSNRIRLSGQGTQKIEDELNSLFPKAKILRMDTDSTYSKHSYAKNFEDFDNQKYDILLGTQMIAKGLDFPNVTLVGVIDADSGLYSLDFRGVERVFSLITQVVGRSGRALKSGRAFIQTYNPNNTVINLASQQNYVGFYNDEIVNRSILKYPPYCDICIVTFSGLKEERVDNASYTFLAILKNEIEKYDGEIPLQVLQPIKPSVYRLNEKFRQKVIIKCKCNNKFRKYLRECLKLTGKNKNFRNITITVDINGDINS